ncbi:uracil-DNA glycosylase family protein [Mesobaculum littorinae]|uniref:Uracil-DNA glycosylase family protein n=1 Tax=Mesobaculum littorinae TaxID=2486419 RepID=A0A438ADI5_9RHOB|nr:uracil-DNA glycosylase family protein [Mesobaculum littorinae]RVV96760.1 uracil-DNA glycosylase family protein [Mesobaculum littorinae]
MTDAAKTGAAGRWADDADRGQEGGDSTDLTRSLAGCRICADRFAATATHHAPNPVLWFRPGARILIASQAPGLRVHEANTPFWDQSGKRLRQWLGVSDDEFYDRSRVAIVPMAFCFPGYDAKGGDLPPPPICATTWRRQVLGSLPDIRLTVLIGGYAQKWHLGTREGVTATVARWREHAPGVFPLPHPSWRNTAWLKRNPWFEDELVPVLRTHVREALG